MDPKSGNSETQSNKEISARDAAKEAGSSGTLLKPKNFEAAIEALPLDEIHKNALKQLSRGRHEFHLLRLLDTARSPEEHEFALDYIDNFSLVAVQLEKRHSDEEKLGIFGLVNGDSSDTTMWWTLAPYLHKLLKETGLSSEDSLVKIFEWANIGDRHKIDPTQIHLSGLEGLNRKIGADTFVLSKNPNGVSHQYAHQLASKILSALRPR